MKQFTLLLITILFANLTNATILRCNNNSISGVFTTAQAAHDAANAGDTIHLEPSGNYGDLIISKKIVLFSTGDFIAQNPGIQATQFMGWCTSVQLITGSEYSVISAKVSQYISIQVHNISIANTHCPNINLGATGYSLNNIRISQSIIEDAIYANYGWTDLQLNNNYIRRLICYNNSASSYGNFQNNIFGDNVTTIYSATLSNNIFMYGITYNNCSLINNISSLGYGSQLPNNNGNVNEVDLSTVFQNYGYFDGDDFQLLISYPNQNIGMYAGSSPYRQACTPSIPSIYQLTLQTNINNNTLPIQVSTKANN